jgi:UDP-glucose 4-epimerase
MSSTSEDHSANSSVAGSSSPIPARSGSASPVTTPTTEPDTLFDHDVTLTQRYVLVTGGLGFIGSHTSLELLKAGYNVIIVDDLSNSFGHVYERIITTAKIHFDKHGGHLPKTELHAANFRDMASMRDVLTSHCLGSLSNGKLVTDIMGVIHFAGFKAVEESINLPLKYYKNNVSGLIDFLDLLQSFDIRTFIFSSSATVYGTLADGSRLLREEYCVHEGETFTDHGGLSSYAEQGCVGITNPYGRTKFFGEAILADVAKSDDSWNIIGLRYFNPIGCDPLGLLGEDPKLPPSNLVPVVTKVITGQYKELSVFGDDWDTRDGSAVRDFIHVTDLAKGHIAALDAVEKGKPRGCYRVFNLGTGTGYSVLEVVQAMESVTGQPIPKKVVGRRPGDVQSSVATAERAQRELGWQTQQSLMDACRDVINHLQIVQDSSKGT